MRTVARAGYIPPTEAVPSINFMFASIVSFWSERRRTFLLRFEVRFESKSSAKAKHGGDESELLSWRSVGAISRALPDCLRKLKMSQQNTRACCFRVESDGDTALSAYLMID